MSLMPGLSYTVYIASLGSLRIQVDTQGNITSSNQTAAIGGVGSIRFATAPVYIYPQGMPGSWRISHVTDFVSGPRTLALVRGLKYEVLADFGEATQVTIDAAGKIVEGQVSLGSFALNFQPPPPPDLDADDDGVFDSIDLCANTVLKNGKRTKIDEAGCSRQQKREILRAELKKARELARAERARIREEERLVRLAAAEARKALKFQNKLP
jgi:hypothetical protein